MDEADELVVDDVDVVVNEVVGLDVEDFFFSNSIFSKLLLLLLFLFDFDFEFAAFF